MEGREGHPALTGRTYALSSMSAVKPEAVYTEAFVAHQIVVSDTTVESLVISGNPNGVVDELADASGRASLQIQARHSIGRLWGGLGLLGAAENSIARQRSLPCALAWTANADARTSRAGAGAVRQSLPGTEHHGLSRQFTPNASDVLAAFANDMRRYGLIPNDLVLAASSAAQLKARRGSQARYLLFLDERPAVALGIGRVAGTGRPGDMAMVRPS